MLIDRITVQQIKLNLNSTDINMIPRLTFGSVLGAYLFMGWPSLFTKNLVKFHLIKLENKEGLYEIVHILASIQYFDKNIISTILLKFQHKTCQGQWKVIHSCDLLYLPMTIIKIKQIYALILVNMSTKFA